ncbi:hypothetical protein BH753_gp156 [Bacillus phage Shbh1]|uniref:Uncharacterized protein n=1 Tax=Bacillus phage Shbh1 TaxID=1796992 RepID=A0A142F1I1_9CAUD|nr:hypothetical protein BH753_gp156 [Bacillus phage Shbh1]AMQ66638.1 hypothetical protein [Bacillus phage Shbh1]
MIKIIKIIGEINMTRKKSLNVHNTDRLFNLNLTTKQEESSFIKVTSVDSASIRSRLIPLKKQSTRFSKRDKKTYMIYKQRYGDDTLQNLVFDHGGFVYYYTTDKVPIPVITKLAEVPQSEIIYFCKKEHKFDDVRNVQLASMATKVSVDVPIVLPDINPYDYLFSLYPLRYHVDKVRISFPALREGEIEDRHREYYVFYNGAYHLKSKYKYECFKYLQDPLSTWKMNIWLICDSLKDQNKIEEMIQRDHRRFRRAENPQKGGD